MVISVASIKGGVGKSTIAVNLATMLSRGDKCVKVVDMDISNQTTSTFFSEREDIECLECHSYDDILDVSKSNCDIVFDLAGFDSDLIRAVLVASDVILVPFKKGIVEEKSIIKFIEVLMDIGGIIGNKRIILVPSMFHFKNSFESIKSEVQGVLELGIEISKPINLSSNFVKSMNESKSVYELGFSKQSLQIINLANMVLNEQRG
jgi:chromosome partitioning protein